MKLALKWFLVFLLGSELTYVLASNGLLASSFFLSSINGNSQSLRIGYDSAWSIWPGVVHVRGFRFRLQDNNIQLYFKLDEARVRVRLTSLTHRLFKANQVEGRGLEFHLRQRRPGRPPAVDELSRLPPVPGLEIASPRQPPEPVNRKALWKIELADIHIARVREIWIESYRFRGDAEVAGGFHISPLELVWVNPARLLVREGKVWMGQVPMATHLRGEVNGHIRLFHDGEVPGWTLFHFVTAQVHLACDLSALKALDYPLQSVKWLSFAVGKGHFDTRFALEEGRLLAGSRLRLDARELELHARRQKIVGEGTADMRVTSSSARFAVALRKFALSSDGPGKMPFLEGEHAEILVSTRELRLPEAFSRVDLRVSVPDARLVSLERLEDFVPKESGIRLRGGHGTFSAEIATSYAHPGRDRGKMTARIKDAQVELAHVGYRADVDLMGLLSGGDIRRGRLEIAGTQLSLSGLQVLTPGFSRDPDSPQWWGLLQLPHGEIALGKTIAISGRSEVTGKNARPILVLMGDSVPGIVKGILSFDNLSGQADFSLDDKRLFVEKAVATGGATRIRGWIRELGERRNGEALLEYGPLRAGLEIANDKVSLKLFDPERWYKESSAKIPSQAIGNVRESGR